MLIIEDQKLEIKCKDIDNWEEMSCLIAEAFVSWKQEIKKKAKPEFIDDFPMIPTITFILGTITTGFLKQIGEEIWKNLRKTVNQNNVYRQKPNMKLNFNYEGVKFIVEVEHNDLETLHQVLKNLDGIITEISKEEEQVKFVLGENGKFKRKF